jgi:hypothetical protein
MKALWSHLCQHSIVDSENNNLTLVGLIEDMHIVGGQDPQTGVWARLPRSLTLVTLWVRDEETTPEIGIQRIVVRTPSGEVAEPPGGSPQREVVLDKFLRLRFRAGITAFPYYGDGTYGLESQALEAGVWVPKVAALVRVRFKQASETDDEEQQEPISS